MPAVATISHVGSLTTSGYSIEYIIVGAIDEFDAQDAVIGVMPASVGGLSTAGESITLYVNNVSVTIDGGCGTYKANVSYDTGTGGNLDVFTGGNDTVISLQISSVQITKYFLPVVASGGDIVDAGWVDEGVQVDEPVVTFSVRKKYGSVPSGWGTTLADKVGMVNNAVLFGASIGSLKYIGATVQEFPEAGVTNETSYSHNYLYRKAQTAFSLTPAPGMTALSIPAHKGWEYLNFKRRLVKHGADQQLRAAVGWQILRTALEGAIAP